MLEAGVIDAHTAALDIVVGSLGVYFIIAFSSALLSKWFSPKKTTEQIMEVEEGSGRNKTYL